MQRTLTNRRRVAILSLILAATGFVAVQPALAQDPAPAQPSTSRFRVLVPSLERKGEVPAGFGKKTAELVSKAIEKLPTHTAVDSKEFKDALKRFKLKEEDLDCVKNRQLAVQINAELVMCGQYEKTATGHSVAAQFISARTGETFEVAPFEVATQEAAAAHIYGKFSDYVKQISLAAFCNDYLASQQYPNALQNCNDALAINPNSQVALMGKGMALYRMGMAADQSAVTDSAKLLESEMVYAKVLELNPVNQDALKQAGIIAARVGKAEASRQYFRQYMELNPGDVSVRLAIAGEASKNGDPEGALRIIEEGLAADSANSDLQAYAGHFAVQAAAKSDDKTKSSALYESAVRYYMAVFAARDTATDVSVLQNLMLANIQLGKKQEAVDVGARATAARPGEAALWAVYATALTTADKSTEALTAIDKAMAIDAKFPKLAVRRATALLSLGRLDEAKQAFAAAIENGSATGNDAAQAVFIEGFTKYRANDFDTALEYFSVSRDLATDGFSKGQANFWTGMVHYQRGISVSKPQTAKAARSALPVFQRALEYLTSTGVSEYASETKGINLSQTVSAVRQYIDIQNQIIKRG